MAERKRKCISSIVRLRRSIKPEHHRYKRDYLLLLRSSVTGDGLLYLKRSILKYFYPVFPGAKKYRSACFRHNYTGFLVCVPKKLLYRYCVGTVFFYYRIESIVDNLKPFLNGKLRSGHN